MKWPVFVVYKNAPQLASTSFERGFPRWRWLKGKESACNVGAAGSIPGSGRSPGVEHSNPLQYSCLENPMERSLAGYSPWGHKELDTTEWLTQLIYNVVLVSGIQHSEYIHLLIFQIPFPYILLQNIEYSSLCYTVGPCWLSI